MVQIIISARVWRRPSWTPKRTQTATTLWPFCSFWCSTRFTRNINEVWRSGPCHHISYQAVWHDQVHPVLNQHLSNKLFVLLFLRVKKLREHLFCRGGTESRTNKLFFLHIPSMRKIQCSSHQVISQYTGKIGWARGEPGQIVFFSDWGKVAWSGPPLIIYFSTETSWTPKRNQTATGGRLGAFWLSTFGRHGYRL